MLGRPEHRGVQDTQDQRTHLLGRQSASGGEAVRGVFGISPSVVGRTSGRCPALTRFATLLSVEGA